MKIACSQYQAHDISSLREFEEHVDTHLKEAAEQGAQLILFPEFLPIELLTLDQTAYEGREAMEKMFHKYAVSYEDYLHEYFTKAAATYQMAIASGTYFIYEKETGKYRNRAFVYQPDGTIYWQDKVHRAIEMVYNRHMMTPGDVIGTFDYAGAKVSLNVCYDNSFPESARSAQAQNADIILSPVCAYDEYGKVEQALFTHARASENFLFVVNAQMTGQISFPYHIPYGSTFSGRSGIYCPIFPSLSADGVLARAKDGEDQVLVADCNIERLQQLKKEKKVGVLVDYRPEVYKKYLLK